jgi:hypothetical protein
MLVCRDWLPGAKEGALRGLKSNACVEKHHREDQLKANFGFKNCMKISEAHGMRVVGEARKGARTAGNTWGPCERLWHDPRAVDMAVGGF